MRILAVAAALACMLGCASVRRACGAEEWLQLTLTHHRASLDDVKPRYLSLVDIDTIPAPARSGVIEWVDKEVQRVAAKMKAGDEVWYFREEKCPNCHWYREGYALIRGCDVVDEITISDDM